MRTPMTPPPDLLEAAQPILESIGWRGYGELWDHFYCEFCGASSLASDEVPHAEDCAVLAFSRAIAHEEGLRANARIRTEPLLQTIQARDAAGMLRLGYRPEQEQEDEGEER